MTPRILIIAGSDSGGGAGIQADIKTVTMLGGHAMTAITAVTAQNTVSVQAVHHVPADIVLAQIDACVDDIGVDAIKVGMIGSAETAFAVARRLVALDVPIVVDPVMVATSGSVLADEETVKALDQLLSLATLATPNLPELAALGGEERLLGLAGAVLVKGGHAEGPVVTDRLLRREGGERLWQAPRIDTTHMHGTGCTLASAIATGLGNRLGLVAAIVRGLQFVRLSLREAPGFGAGSGPLGQQRVRLDLGPEMRLNQISLPGGADPQARAFYSALGLTPIVDSPGNSYSRFEAPGGATLSLHEGQSAVYFECNDLDGQVERLREAGFAFDGPEEQPWLWREAWTRDPVGNRVCLYQADENRRFPPWRLADDDAL